MTAIRRYTGPQVNPDDEGILLVYDTVAEAEVATGIADNRLVYVVETNTIYRSETNGSAYTRDGTFVLNTGDGGDTRLLAEAGQHLCLIGSHLQTLSNVNHIRCIGTGDNYPVLDIRGLHNSIQYCFDAYYVGATAKSSSSTSNFMIQKGLLWGLYGATSIAAGSDITWTNIIQAYASGYVSIGPIAAPEARCHVYGNDTGASWPILYAHQDHASSTGPLIKGVHDGSGTVVDLERGTTDDATGGVSKFTRLRGGAAGTDASVLWNLDFYGANDAGTPETIQYAQIEPGISDASDGTEGGFIKIKIADGVDGSLDTMIEASSNKLAFFGETPAVQSTYVADFTATGVYADDDDLIEAKLNACLACLIGHGLMASS